MGMVTNNNELTLILNKLEKFEENFELETLDNLNRFESSNKTFTTLNKKEFLEELENW